MMEETNEKNYELIPLGKEVLKIPLGSKCYSGVLECTLTNMTPIFVGGEMENGKNKFSYDEKYKKYIIPASTLKGMIRGIVDMFTNSVVVESKIEKKYLNKKSYEFIDKKFHPSNDNNNLSISEEIFGAIKNSQKNIQKDFTNIAGKLYFTDAKIISEKEKMNKDFLLKALYSPKIDTILEKENEKVIGRKYYKHDLEIEYKKYNVNNKNTKIELMLEDNSFEFKVYFENVTAMELSILIYSLNLEDNMYHKIGRGKALGMGSCKIEVNRLKVENTEKITEEEERYVRYDSFKSKPYKSLKIDSFLEKGKRIIESKNKENLKILRKILSSNE